MIAEIVQVEGYLSAIPLTEKNKILKYIGTAKPGDIVDVQLEEIREDDYVIYSFFGETESQGKLIELVYNDTKKD